jgi:hypothetical protein
MEQDSRSNYRQQHDQQGGADCLGGATDGVAKKRRAASTDVESSPFDKQVRLTKRQVTFASHPPDCVPVVATSEAETWFDDDDYDSFLDECRKSVMAAGYAFRETGRIHLGGTVAVNDHHYCVDGLEKYVVSMVAVIGLPTSATDQTAMANLTPYKCSNI